MDTGSFLLDLRRSFSVTLHWGWLLVAGMVFAGGLAYLFSARQPPVYEATTLVLVELPAARTLDYNSVLASERLTRTYAERLATRPVLAAVIHRTGVDLSVAELQAAVKIQPLRDTQLIQVRVQARDPEMAALLANTLVTEFSARDRVNQAQRFVAFQGNLDEQLVQVDGLIQTVAAELAALSPGQENDVARDRLEAELAQHRQAYTSLLQTYEQSRLAEAQSAAMVAQEEPAEPPAVPIRPRVAFNTLLGAAFGFLLAAGVVLLVETLDDRLRSPEEVLRSLGLPILGFIAHQDGSHGPPLAALQPRSLTAEAFRTLRTNLDFAGVDRPLRSLLIASPTPADGKSWVAANLAVTLAQAERRVVLVDGDLRRPVQHKRFGLPGEPGLSDLFLKFRQGGEEAFDLEPYLQPSGSPCLKVLVAGSLPPNPAELLGAESLPAILNRLLEEAEILIFDSPPLLAVTDAAVLAPRLDGALLVVKPGATRLAACRQALEQLKWVGANLLGAVVNGAAPGGAPEAYYCSLDSRRDWRKRVRAFWKACLASRSTGWLHRRRAGPG